MGMALDCLSVIPMLALIGIGDVAAYTRVIVHEHATHTQCNVVRDTSNNGASILAFMARRVLAVMASFLASQQPGEHGPILTWPTNR
jgi:hypothetical protein